MDSFIMPGRGQDTSNLQKQVDKLLQIVNGQNDAIKTLMTQMNMAREVVGDLQGRIEKLEDKNVFSFLTTSEPDEDLKE